MKRLMLCLAFLLTYPISTESQNNNDFIIPEHVKKIPKRNQDNIVLLTEYLVAPCSSDKEKVAAIFAWISQNIKYDVKALVRGKIKHQDVEETIIRKKGVCTQYSELFTAMCDLAGVKSFVVNGYAKGLGYRKNEPFIRSNHAWNVVYFDGEWHVLDMTWGSGFVWYYDYTNPKKVEKARKRTSVYKKMKYFKDLDVGYYLSKPQNLVETHFPWTPEFQLLEDPIHILEFEKDSILEFSDDTLLDYKAVLAKNLDLTKADMEFEMCYDSHMHNTKNHFDKAAAIITRNYQLYENETIQIAEKRKYSNMLGMFEQAEHLLTEHGKVVKQLNKKRLDEIRHFEKVGYNVYNTGIGYNPLGDQSLKTAQKPFRKQLYTLSESFTSQVEKKVKQEEKLEGAERLEHRLNLYPEWDSIQWGMTQYTAALNRLEDLQDSIVVVGEKAIQELDSIRKDLYVRCSELQMLQRMEQVLSWLEQMEIYRDEQKEIRKRLGESRKLISNFQSDLRQVISEEQQIIKKNLRAQSKADGDVTMLELEYQQNISNSMAFYENKMDVIQLKERYIQGRIIRLNSNDTFHQSMLKRTKKFKEKLDVYVLGQRNKQESLFNSEMGVKDKWMSYTKTEKSRFNQYLKRVESMEKKR